MALEYLDAPVILVVLLCSLIIYSVNFNLKRAAVPLPPGPRKLPILGNLFNVPRINAHITYKNWGQEYGGSYWCSQSRKQG